MLGAVATLVLQTPEGIGLERRIAAAGSRFCAACLDALVILAGYLFATLAILAVLAVDVTGLSGVVVGVLFGGLPLCIALYHLVCHLVWRGQTPGKRLLGLRVVSADGYPASVGQHLLRSALWPVDAVFPPMPFGLLGLGLIVCTAKHQRLGDIVAGTLVVCDEHESSVADPYPNKRWASLSRRTLVDRPGLVARLDAADHDFLRRLLSRTGLAEGERRGLLLAVAKYYRERLELPAFEDARAFLGELYLFVRDARGQRSA